MSLTKSQADTLYVSTKTLQWKMPVSCVNDLVCQYPSPRQGWIVYVMEKGTFYVRNATKWVEMKFDIISSVKVQNKVLSIKTDKATHTVDLSSIGDNLTGLTFINNILTASTDKGFKSVDLSSLKQPLRTIINSDAVPSMVANNAFVPGMMYAALFPANHIVYFQATGTSGIMEYGMHKVLGAGGVEVLSEQVSVYINQSDGNKLVYGAAVDLYNISPSIRESVVTGTYNPTSGELQGTVPGSISGMKFSYRLYTYEYMPGDLGGLVWIRNAKSGGAGGTGSVVLPPVVVPVDAIDIFDVSTLIRETVVMGTYNPLNNEMTNHVNGSISGMKFSYLEHIYEYMPGDSGNLVWVRNSKKAGGSGNGVVEDDEAIIITYNDMLTLISDANLVTKKRYKITNRPTTDTGLCGDVLVTAEANNRLSENSILETFTPDYNQLLPFGVGISPGTSVINDIEVQNTVIKYTPFALKFTGNTGVVVYGETIVSYTRIDSSNAVGNVGVANGGDDNTTVLRMPFTFEFAGINYDYCVIDTNGRLVFGSYASSVYYNIFSMGQGSEPMITLSWADMNAPNNSIKYFTTGIFPNRQFIIDFYEVPRYGSSTQLVTGQIILEESSNIVKIGKSKSVPGSFSGIQFENGSSNNTTPVGQMMVYTPVPEKQYTYQWSPSNLLDTDNEKIVTATVFQDTTFTLTITDEINNVTQHSITITPIDVANVIWNSKTWKAANDIFEEPGTGSGWVENPLGDINGNTIAVFDIVKYDVSTDIISFREDALNNKVHSPNSIKYFPWGRSNVLNNDIVATQLDYSLSNAKEINFENNIILAIDFTAFAPTIFVNNIINSDFPKTSNYSGYISRSLAIEQNLSSNSTTSVPSIAAVNASITTLNSTLVSTNDARLSYVVADTGYSSLKLPGLNTATGGSSRAFGVQGVASGEHAVTFGYLNESANNWTIALGVFTTAKGIGSFSSGIGRDLGNYSRVGNFALREQNGTLLAKGYCSFVHSFNNDAQVGGHGALASYSAILGGTNANVSANATGTVLTASNNTKVPDSFTNNGTTIPFTYKHAAPEFVAMKPGSGYYLCSPNGNYHKLAVSNTGNLLINDNDSGKDGTILFSGTSGAFSNATGISVSANNTFVFLPMNNVEININNRWDGFMYEIPYSGNYIITSKVLPAQGSQNTSVNKDYYAGISVNVPGDSAEGQWQVVSSSSRVSINLTTIKHYNIGDKVGLSHYQENTSFGILCAMSITLLKADPASQVFPE